jgi:holo-ACP synthase
MGAVAAMSGPMVALEQILEARERRAARHAAALRRFHRPIVSLTVVMPGPVKDGVLPRRVLEEALGAVEDLCRNRQWPVLRLQVFWQTTGPEALYVIDGEAEALKSACMELEDVHPMGRLWDLDVIVVGRRILSRKEFGYPARRCLVCERPAFECGRSRRHGVDELLGAIERLANERDLRRAA